MRLWLAGMLLAVAVPAAAQTVEIVPFGGYRFGGGFDVVEGGRVAEVKEFSRATAASSATRTAAV